MKTRVTIVLITVFLFSCNLDTEKHQDNLSSLLNGEWIFYPEKTNEFLPPPPTAFPPLAFGFCDDKIEFLNGFTKLKIDTITWERSIINKGSITTYEIREDSIFINSPFDGKWEFKWKLIAIHPDTLILAENDTMIFKMVRLKYNQDTLPSFDQIVYSRSGCYGYCPILDIAVSSDNKVYVQGEGYVDSLGFFSATIDSCLTNFIFSKFRKADVLNLDDEYSFGPTDNEAITTTYIKNGKIVKTIVDYGKFSTIELLWAYTAIENVLTKADWNRIPYDEPFYPKLHYYTFYKDSLILVLEKSESFYLWTELRKANLCEKKFLPKYNVWFSGNYIYWGPDPNEKRIHKNKIHEIKSDGRFFTFQYENGDSVTYDIGYNFIDRNFTEDDFKIKTEYDF